jgi:dethiobiotin synthetase
MLEQARTQLESGHDLLLVEGEGGLLVPITRDVSYATFFSRWSCELLIVAGNRLGVLNHVLLTVQVAEQAGLTVRGVVLSTISDREPSVAEATNFDVLQQLLPGQALYRFPWVERADDPDALAAAAAASGMDALL